ncbi:phosphopantetheine-binding protein [Actinokineospora auranticolor]|uniref:Phosphopantetheine binding protein n=1 Tax=Actinokineospora auranticolor TaxID=155976 RepID=A0A2S6H1P8_9PSEU|nr:phosphopantetheine-binding protein [Actinokineospora auranticolor]PPK71405.1 phosphopantetheine binding protein [Actinokineospora auranticolor]
MTTAEFVRIIRDEIGLDVRADDLDRDLDEVRDWDSVHLLALAISLEKHSAARVSLPDLLEARTLGAIHGLVTA